MARRASRGLVASAGPFLGVKDDTTATDPKFAQGLTNVVFADAGPQAGLVARPGFSKHTLAVAAAENVFEHVAKDGTRTKFVFDNGKVYRWSWTSTTTGVSTFTDVTPVGVAISDRVSCVSFADVMIVSDGQNRPWKATNLSATPITGAYLTGMAGAAYGPPTVYYDKLFFIKANERNTIVWSEEEDPDTGYEAGGYNNAWTLAQTSNEPLVAIRGTNEALYYWRPHSIGMITGAVDSEFVAAGVHDSISLSVGAQSGWSVVEAEGSFYFADTEARLSIFTPGQGITDLWRDMGTTTTGATVDLTTPIIGCYSVHDKCVVFAPALQPLNRYTLALVVSTTTKHGLGTWTGPARWQAMGVVTDPKGIPRLAVLDATTPGVWVQESTSLGITRTTDYDGTNTTSPSCSVVCPLVGFDAVAAKDFQRLTVLAGSTNTVRVDYETPRGTYGTAQTITATGEGKAVAGINAQSARWIRPRVRTDATAGAFSFQSLEVQGVVITDAPGVA